MNTDERLTYIDLSNLYNQTNSSLQVEPGDLAQSIMKMYNIKPVTAFTIVTDAPDPRFRYIIHVNEDDELIQKFNELLDETSDYLEAANKILQENKDLIALIIFDGYDVGISFAKI